jgi:hypothetical protein
MLRLVQVTSDVVQGFGPEMTADIVEVRCGWCDQVGGDEPTDDHDDQAPLKCSRDPTAQRRPGQHCAAGIVQQLTWS